MKLSGCQNETVRMINESETPIIISGAVNFCHVDVAKDAKGGRKFDR